MQTIKLTLKESYEQAHGDDLICDLRDEEPGKCLFTDYGLHAELNGVELIVRDIPEDITVKVLAQIFFVAGTYDDSPVYVFEAITIV